MTQLTFLDAPLARHTDPATSHEAAEHAQRKLGALQQAMVEAFSHAQLTAMEAADRCVVRYRGQIESYRKRAKELVRLGLIVECEPRVCRITGQKATTYVSK